MKFKYLLFDLDGTLTDPFEGITKCVQYALASCGVEECNLNNLKKFIGPPLVYGFMTFYGLSEDKANFALLKYRERFADVGWCENRIFDGIPELLCDLKDAGYKILLATSKPENFAKRIIEHFGIDKYIDIAVGATLDGIISEKYEVIAECFRRAGNDMTNDNSLMIGDRKHDILGAKEFNMKSLGVRFGYADEGELEAAGADYIADDITALRDFLL